MEPFTITIANEMSMIGVAQASAAAYCRIAGTGEEIARQTELMIEEIVTNIFQYEYLPGQRETLEMTLSITEDRLKLLISFRGIPFDIDHLKQWEKMGFPEIINQEGRGIGLRLLGELSDDIQYHNLGWEGQEICLHRFVPVVESKPLPAEKIEPISDSHKIAIRRMRPDDAAAISKLAYFAYRYTYIREYVYDPEQVRLANEDGRMKSYVIANEKTGEILGHLAQFPDDLFTAVPEVAAGFVHPYFRGGGRFNELVALMVRDAQTEGWQGVCGMAVTSHIYSQRAALRAGMMAAALFVSHVRPLAMPDIKDQVIARESFLYLVRIFDPNPRQPYYAPTRHRAMIAKITDNVLMRASFIDVPVEALLADRSEMESRTDTHQRCGHLVIRLWGRDALRKVSEVLRRWCLDRLETIYLYLPLTQPATAPYSAKLEEWGFFFAGLMPGSAGADWLVLQYLNNQRYDYRLLQAATPFGLELIDYVRVCDPNANIGGGE